PAWFTYLREIGMVSVILPFKTRGFRNFDYEKNNIKPSDIFLFKSLFQHLRHDYYSILPKAIKGSAYSNYVMEGSTQIGYEDLDDFLEKILSTALPKSDKKKKYIVAYWPKFDGISHDEGIQSQSALDHFRGLDKKLGSFSSKLKNKDSKIRLIITAPFFYVRPSKVTDFENYIRTHLNHAGELIKGETLIKENYYGLYEPNKRLFDRTGDYILLMKDNYILRDQLIGEIRHELVGNHGGLSIDELYVPLIII
ncbi:MAG: alkaline phosphatase family protein, partial [Promethearchaeota archaeon]